MADSYDRGSKREAYQVASLVSSGTSGWRRTSGKCRERVPTSLAALNSCLVMMLLLLVAK